MYPSDRWSSSRGKNQQYHEQNIGPPNNSQRPRFHPQNPRRSVLLEIPLCEEPQDFSANQSYMRQPVHALRPHQNFAGNQNFRQQPERWQTQDHERPQQHFRGNQGFRPHQETYIQEDRRPPHSLSDNQDFRQHQEIYSQVDGRPLQSLSGNQDFRQHQERYSQGDGRPLQSLSGNQDFRQHQERYSQGDGRPLQSLSGNQDFRQHQERYSQGDGRPLQSLSGNQDFRQHQERYSQGDGRPLQSLIGNQDFRQHQEQYSQGNGRPLQSLSGNQDFRQHQERYSQDDERPLQSFSGNQALRKQPERWYPEEDERPHQSFRQQSEIYSREDKIPLPSFGINQGFRQKQEIYRQEDRRPPHSFSDNQGLRQQQERWHSHEDNNFVNQGQHRPVPFQNPESVLNLGQIRPVLNHGVRGHQSHMSNQGPRSPSNQVGQKCMSNQSPSSPSNQVGQRSMSNHGPMSPSNKVGQSFMSNQDPMCPSNQVGQISMSNQDPMSPSNQVGQSSMSNQDPMSPSKKAGKRFMSKKGPRSPSNLVQVKLMSNQGQQRKISNQGSRSPDLDRSRPMSNQSPRNSLYLNQPRPNSSPGLNRTPYLAGQRSMSEDRSTKNSVEMQKGLAVLSSKPKEGNDSNNLTEEGSPKTESTSDSISKYDGLSENINLITMNETPTYSSNTAPETSAPVTKSSADEVVESDKIESGDSTLSAENSFSNENISSPAIEITVEFKTSSCSNSIENGCADNQTRTETSEHVDADFHKCKERVTELDNSKASGYDDCTYTDLEKIKNQSESLEFVLTTGMSDKVTTGHIDINVTNANELGKQDLGKSKTEAIEVSEVEVSEGDEKLDKITELESMTACLNVSSVDVVLVDSEKNGNTLNDAEIEIKPCKADTESEDIAHQVGKMNISETRSIECGENEDLQMEMRDVTADSKQHTLCNEHEADADDSKQHNVCNEHESDADDSKQHNVCNEHKADADDSKQHNVCNEHEADADDSKQHNVCNEHEADADDSKQHNVCNEHEADADDSKQHNFCNEHEADADDSKQHNVCNEHESDADDSKQHNVCNEHEADADDSKQHNLCNEHEADADDSKQHNVCNEHEEDADDSKQHNVCNEHEADADDSKQHNVCNEHEADADDSKQHNFCNEHEADADDSKQHNVCNEHESDADDSKQHNVCNEHEADADDSKQHNLCNEHEADADDSKQHNVCNEHEEDADDSKQHNVCNEHEADADDSKQHNLCNEHEADADEPRESRMKPITASGATFGDDASSRTNNSTNIRNLIAKYGIKPVSVSLARLDDSELPASSNSKRACKKSKVTGKSARHDLSFEEAAGNHLDEVEEDTGDEKCTEIADNSSDDDINMADKGEDTDANYLGGTGNDISKGKDEEVNKCSEVKMDSLEGDSDQLAPVKAGDNVDVHGVESIENKNEPRQSKHADDPCDSLSEDKLDMKENVSPDKNPTDRNSQKARQSPTTFLEFADDESDDDMLDTAPAFLRSIEEITGRPQVTATPEKAISSESQSDVSRISDGRDASMEYYSPLEPRRRPQPQCRSKFTLDNLLEDHKNNFEHEKEMDEIKSELQAGIQQGGFVQILNKDEEADGPLQDSQKEILALFQDKQSHMCDHRPGLPVFNDHNYLLLFDATLRPLDCGFTVTGNTHLEKHLATVVPDQYLRLLTTSVIPLLFSKLPCQADLLRWLFFLMSVEQNNQTCEGCQTILQEILHKHHKTLTCFPDVYDLLSVLVNYGADLETLVPDDFVGMETIRSRLYHQPNYQRPVAQDQGDGAEVRGYQKNNLFMVLEFMALSLYRNGVTITADELDLLLVVLCKASLDESFKNSCGVDAFHNCVAMAVKQYTDTDWETHRLRVSRWLATLSDHHHNMASIAELLPQTGPRDMYLQRTVCFLMLSRLLLQDDTGMTKDVGNVQIRHLHQFVGPMKELLIKEPYKLSSIVTILDICVGINITLRSFEREELKTLIELVHSIRARDNVSMLDRTKVKDMMVRLTSSWSLDIQTMKGKQTKIFEYAKHESPVKIMIETVEASQVNEDSASNSESSSEEEEMPCKMQKMSSNEEVPCKTQKMSSNEEVP